MPMRKRNKQYHFSVEGEVVEKLYLEWLQKLINRTAESAHTVSLKAFVQKNPLKHAKGLAITGKTVIYHFCDYESDDPCHVEEFKNTMDNMKKAKRLGKQIDYKFGYSNLTFDLWIILHKQDLNHTIAHRDNYVESLNRAYNEQFRSMDEYKRKANFERILRNITLSDVKNAIRRAKNIMQINEERGYILHEYKGYKYYKENPSLMVWDAIEKILIDCKLM
jgi:hypothetical protein